MPEKTSNAYDDGNIPKVDLPQSTSNPSAKSQSNAERLPESTRPRKDGPGGDDGE